MRSVDRRGVYHKVRKGETLWKIAKAYNVSIKKITRSNNIPNVAHVEENQLIFVPGATKVRKIPVAKGDKGKNEFIWPVKGKILFYFGEARGGKFNNGIGIKANEGESIRAAREGRVVFADYLQGYAHTVIIDHLDNYFSVYSQNAKLLAKVGDYVQKGDSIARIGRSGGQAYLHFEIRKNEKPANPLFYLP